MDCENVSRELDCCSGCVFPVTQVLLPSCSLSFFQIPTTSKRTLVDPATMNGEKTKNVWDAGSPTQQDNYARAVSMPLPKLCHWAILAIERIVPGRRHQFALLPLLVCFLDRVETIFHIVRHLGGVPAGLSVLSARVLLPFAFLSFLLLATGLSRTTYELIEPDYLVVFVYVDDVVHDPGLAKRLLVSLVAGPPSRQKAEQKS